MTVLCKAGAASLGELVSASPLTVQEVQMLLVGWLNPLTLPCQLKVHLSYNFISDRGAVELLQAEHSAF